MIASSKIGNKATIPKAGTLYLISSLFLKSKNQKKV